jgi:hypothetical protein
MFPWGKNTKQKKVYSSPKSNFKKHFQKNVKKKIWPLSHIFVYLQPV